MKIQPRAVKCKSLEKKGFTLIELLIAMAVASIVMAAIVSAYQIQVRGKNVQEVITDMNQACRSAIAVMEREIRQAGCDPENGGNAGILVADTAELRITMDIDGGAVAGQPDGDVDDADEDIWYALTNDADGDGIADGTPCHLGRQTGGGMSFGAGAEILAENIDGLNFVYFGPDDNGDGQADVLTPTPLSAANRSRIRMIQVTLVARSGEELRGFLGDYTDTNTYTNQQDAGNPEYWDLDPDSDLPGADAEKFRRLQLTQTVYCRNMGL